MEQKKIKLVISDFHLSRGPWLPDGRRNPLEDFHQDDRFYEFLDYYSSGDLTNADVELVINGDFFDPLAVIPVPKAGEKLRPLDYPSEVEEESAVKKFQQIIQAHPITMKGLRLFIQRGKKIIFRWGNHDAALLWPKVQDLITRELSTTYPQRIEFQKDPYIFDRICIDHGHQHEYLNQFDEKNIFIERKTTRGIQTIQNLPFGSFFVLGFINRIKLERSYINQVQPFRLYLRFALLIEPMFFFINGFRAAWFFIKMRFITHPMRFARLKKSFFLLLEVFHRPSLEKVAERFFTSKDADSLEFDTLILGHDHQAKMRIFPGGRQYINTGTWTPITSLDMSTLGRRILRTYALIEYKNQKAIATLKVWNGYPHVTEDFS
jgi:UDP-2,3-diacylglucosamine pyrophosphatase LpxH